MTYSINIKKIVPLLFLLICTSFSYAQTISVRSIAPTKKEQKTLPIYDTTLVYIDLSKLSDNIHYFDGQKILFSPNFGDQVEYTHYMGFTVKDSIEMINHPDTVWIKKRRKVREGDYSVVYPKTMAYKPEYVENGIVRKIGENSYPDYAFYRRSGFYTPRSYIDGKVFTIKSISKIEESYGDQKYCMHLIDDEGSAVDFTCNESHMFKYHIEEYFPSILMMAFIDKYRDKYVGKIFRAMDNGSTVYLFKDIATGRYIAADGDLECVDLSLIRGNESSAKFEDDYHPIYGAEIRLFFKNKEGNEFCIPIESEYNYPLHLSKSDYEGYDYKKMYYHIQLNDMILASDYYIQKEAERIQKIEHENRLIKKYGKTYAEMILNGKVQIGMSAEMCRESWGVPDNINRSIGSWGTHEQWCYDWGGYLYMENGILTSIQN